ncbi:MAG: ribosome maturation factor RimP [Pseudomonadota bacterium]
MRQAPEHLINLIEPIVVGLGYECVGIEYNPHPKHGVLRVYIDSEDGILLDDCTKVSHQLSGMLDVEDPLSGNYQLEVSSPGLDRPLFKLEHFEYFAGHIAQLRLMHAVQGRKKVTGRLKGVAGEIIRIQEGEHVYEVPYRVISKARLVPDLKS